MLDFSARLKTLRQEKKITQKQLATDTGLSERGIQNYELGDRKPTYEACIALADFFDVPLDFLVGRGIYRDWEKIMQHRDIFAQFVYQLAPNLVSLRLESIPEIQLIGLLSLLFTKIEFVDKTINLVTAFDITQLEPKKPE